MAGAVSWGSQSLGRRTWRCWEAASLASQAPSAPSRRWELPQCNICAGEMAEGLLQTLIIVNKSSSYPNDKSWSEGRAKGHQTRVTSCKHCCHPRRGAPVCSRMGTGEPGRCQNFSLWISRDCPDVSLPTFRTPQFLAELLPAVPCFVCTYKPQRFSGISLSTAPDLD